MNVDEQDFSPLNIFQSWTKLGVRNAVRAMSDFMCAPVECSEQTIIFARVDELVDVLQLEEDSLPAVCVLQSVSGGIDGFFLFSASTSLISALTSSLNNLLLSGNDATPETPEFSLSQSMLNEWVNIFAGNVISSIKAPKIGTIEMTSSEQTIDMSGAALDFIACQMSVETDLMAICHSRIKVLDSPDEMNVWIVINPGSHLFDLKRLNKNESQLMK